MALPLLLLLISLHSGARPGTATPLPRTSSVVAGDVSEAQRFGSVYAAPRPGVVSREPSPRAPLSTPHGGAMALSLVLRAEDALERLQAKEARVAARAAQWIDAVPLNVDVRHGVWLVAVRVRGP